MKKGKCVALGLCLVWVPLCMGTWDNTEPADNTLWNVAAGLIRNNNDALEGNTGPVRTVINVKEATYGAAGDGSSDDGPEVAAALAAASTGDIVYFPAGSYLLTTFSGVTVTNDIVITGDGWDAVTITGPGTSTNFIILGAGANLVMRDLGFSTFDAVVEGTTNNTDYIEIENCKVTGSKHLYDDNSFSTTGDVDRFRVNNCKLTGITEEAIRFRSPVNEYCSITNCDFEDSTGDACIEIGSNDETLVNEAIIISGNTFQDIATASATLWTVLVYGDGAVITNNVFNTLTAATGSYAIYTKATRSIVANNSIYDGCNGATSDYAAIRMKGQERSGATTPFGHTNLICNNVIVFSTEHIYTAIKIDVSDIVISNNTIDSANAGIVALSEDGVNISGNFIYNALWGIQFRPGGAQSSCVIDGNVLRELGNATSTQAFGIYIHSGEAAITGLVISNNVIQTVEDGAGTAHGIAFRQHSTNNISYVTVSGNSVDTADAGIFSIVVGGTITFMNIVDNTLLNVTVGIQAATFNDTGSKLRNNTGFVSENSGTATLLDSNTTIAVAHGLAATPTVINITWRENPTNVIADWWVDTIGASNFTLNGVDPGASNLDFGWEAKVR